MTLAKCNACTDPEEGAEMALLGGVGHTVQDALGSVGIVHQEVGACEIRPGVTGCRA